MSKRPEIEGAAVGWTNQVAAGPNLGVPVVLLLMVSTVMMAVLTFAGAASLDRSADASARAMTQTLLRQTRRDLAQAVLDVAGSAAVTERLGASADIEGLATYLGRQLRQPLDLESGWIVDAEDRALLGFIGEHVSTADPFELMPSGLAGLVAAARRESALDAAEQHGLLLFDGAIHVVATAAIDLAGTPAWKRPVLIFTRPLDRPFLSRLETLYFVEGVSIVDTPPPEIVPAPPGLFDPEGKPLGYLLLPLVPPGTDLLKQIWPAVASAFASMLLLVGLFVRRVERARQQRRRLEESLGRERDLGQLKSRFINMVSHEIRTPLTTIRAATDLLHRYGEQMDMGERRQELAAIQHEVDVMTDLVEDVMAIGRTEGKDFSLRRRATDPAVFVKALWAELAHGTSRELNLEVEGIEGELELDPTLLRPIVSNLLGNAVKFSPEDAPIEIRLEGDGSELRLIVRDRGIGIPADQLDDVFTPFHRADNVGAISGSGLGLTITKQAVERHGGNMEIDSEVGVGTRVTVRLPLGADEDVDLEETAEVA